MNSQNISLRRPLMDHVPTTAFAMPHQSIYPLALLVCLLAGCAVDNWHGWRAEKVDNNAYEERFHYQLISPGAQFAALPPAVQNSIRAEAGGSDISYVTKETNGSQPVYVIYFVESELYPPLYIAPDGSVLNEFLEVAVGAPQETVGMLTGGPVTGVTLSDLPMKVVKTIQQRAPSSEIDYITKETHADQITYIIYFKDRTHPVLHVSQDGTVLKETAR
jgi:hypothetical protein